jgi:multisubunit Na+/H+ antiporter MnhB subunit
MRTALLVFTLAGLFFLLIAAFSEAKPFTAPLDEVSQIYVEQTMEQSGATNVVAAVTFDWRGFDTFGEATLLLAAATGLRAVLRLWLQRRRETGTA